ncbi:DNA polymerase IV [Actinokineospora iranica]|uniref:DNA polymerase IV n=1 Tax=Actinokineospora iranica TaxID=1271860 RepID=A0A1G6MZC1_9PSEU|nr:DNA polymerase IV [Actinokineospora iranica]SDC60948.1 DNA polymerase-4 [Actinokineospora iranica]
MAGTAWVLHVDLDQFIAAVEVLRRPDLRGLPVVVGGTGDPARREVVATASYEAREFGVRSGIPLRLALKRCPDAVFLPSDPDAYNAASAEVMAVLRESDAVVEVLGWDEAFLGVRTDDPEALAAEIQTAVTERTRLTASVGIGDNKLRAKLATGFAKPAGVFRLTKDNWEAVMADRPTDALWGIGAKTARKLADLGFATVGELARADPDALAARLGPTMGPWYRTLALGAGSTEVVGTPYIPRSHSRETTFQENITDLAVLRETVSRLARQVAEDITADGRPVVRVGVKARFAPFLTRGRSLTLAEPTRSADEIETAALTALDRFELGRPVRLLGVRAEFEQADGGSQPGR